MYFVHAVDKNTNKKFFVIGKDLLLGEMAIIMKKNENYSLKCADTRLSINVERSSDTAVGSTGSDVISVFDTIVGFAETSDHKIMKRAV